MLSGKGEVRDNKGVVSYDLSGRGVVRDDAEFGVHLAVAVGQPIAAIRCALRADPAGADGTQAIEHKPHP